MSLKLALAVAAGGAIGSLARFWIAQAMTPLSHALPWGTILINVAGSFLIGAFGTLTLASGKFPAPEAVRLFVMVGVCGGFTTFSSFSLQTFDLLRAGAGGRAMINVAVSVAVCLAAVAAGHYVAAKLNGGERAVAQADIEELA